jgi:hypothetical protein
LYRLGHKIRTGKLMLSAPLEPMKILGIWGLIFTRGDPKGTVGYLLIIKYIPRHEPQNQ